MAGDRVKQVKKRTWLMPQEVEVWYVLPALRRELALAMIRKELPQKQIAKMLGVTEPAITQYKLKNSKRARGDQVEIPGDFMPEIEKAADKMTRAWSDQPSPEVFHETMTREVNRLIKALRQAGVICGIHREHCHGVKEDCGAC